MIINFEVAVRGRRGSQCSGKIGANDATESGVKSVNFMDLSLPGGYGGRVFGHLADVLQLAEDRHFRVTQFFVHLLILYSFVCQEERNVLAVRTQEESLFAASLDIAQHAYATVDGFIAVADRAESDDLRRAVL